MKRIVIAVIAVLCLIVGAAAASVFWLRSDPGRAWLAREIAGLASTPGETEVATGAITGNIFGAFRVTDIRVRDRDGVWLTVKSADIVWRPFDLLGGAVTVSKADVREVALDRPPASDPAAPETDISEVIADLRDMPSIRIAALNVENLTLGAAVLGEKAVIKITGGIEGTAGDAVSGEFAVTRVDGHAGSIDAKGTYSFAEETLSLVVSAAEPAGGLIARALDIPGLPVFRASVKGEGQLADWKGRVDLSFEKKAAMQADLAIRHKKETAFDMAGTATMPQGGDDLLGRLQSGNHSFHVAGAFSTDDVLSFTEIKWTATLAELTASGRLNLDDLSIGGKAAVRKRGDDALVLTPSDARLASLTADVTATGALATPTLELSFDVGGFELPGTVSADIAGAVTMKPAGGDRSQLDGKVTLRSMAWPDNPELKTLLGDEATLQLRAALDLTKSTVDAESIDIAAVHAGLNGKGRFGWENGDGTASLSLTVPDLAVLRDVAGVPLVGKLVLTADATLQDFGTEVSATLRGEAQAFSTGDTLADSVLGREATFSAEIALADDKVDARKVLLSSGRTSLEADAAYEIVRETLTGSYRLAIEAGEPLALADGVAMDCACSLDGKLSGSLAAIGALGDLSARALRLQKTALETLTAQYDLAKLPDAPEGSVTVKTQTPVGDATARTKLALRDGTLRLTDLDVKAADADLKGALDIPLAGDPISGDLRFDARDLAALFAAARLEGDGAAKGKIALRGTEGRQALDATAQATGLRFHSAPGAAVIGAEKATIKISAADLLAGDRNKVDIRLEKATAGDVTVETATAGAEGSLDRAALTLTAKGEWRGPLAIDAKADFAAEKGRQSLAVSRLQGTLMDKKVSLGKPVRLAWGDAGYTAEPIDLTYGDAKLTGYARMGRKEVDLALSVAGLPMSTVDPFWPLGLKGDVDASAAFKGAWPEPEGKFTISAPRLSVDRARDAPSLAMNIDGDWRRGRLTLSGALKAGDAAPSALKASLPLRLEGSDFFVTMPRDKPVSGRLDWTGETAALWRFAPLTEHLLRGDGKIDVTLSGTVAKPNLQGSLALTDGYYESLEYGTVLKPLDLAIRFDGQRATITRLSAGDTSGGKVDGKGTLNFDAEAGFPFDLALTLKALTAVRRDDVQASASGDLKIAGSTKQARVESKLTTDRVEIRVLDRLPPEVATLDVVEVDRFGKKQPEEKDENPMAKNIDLAIEVEMPRRVFVRGRGIDSEWQGNLKVTGPAGAPRVAGYLTLVRGQLTVVGKTFRMESGSVILPERANEEPTLSLVAAYSGRSLTVRANVDGPVSKPSISLSSVPSVPEDEIVSQVLFDKSSTKLSPYEAAQLALALAELAGKGGSGGILDFARKTLGVDVLQIESVQTDKGSQPVVGAGKYLTDDVYVGVRQGASPDSTSVGVEVEVTPNIFLESDVRRSGESDVGVKFKYDY